MFDFLGSGKETDEKRELEDNIAQIREKVQQEEQEREQQSQRQDTQAAGDQETDRQQRNTREGDTEDEPQRGQQSRQDTGSQQNQPQRQQASTQRDTNQRQRRQRQQDQRQQERRQRQPQQREHKAAEQRSTEEQLQDLQGTENRTEQDIDRRSGSSRQQYGSDDGAGQPRSQDTASSTSRPSSENQSPARQRGRSEEDTISRKDLQEEIASRPEQDRTQEDTEDAENTGDITAQESKISSRAGEAAGARLTREEVPNPPETKELDIPDIQKGPLFITMNKFKEALTTMSQMKSLAEDLETQIGALENTLEEDRETQQEFRQLLDDTVQGAENIQDIVSPDAGD